MLANIALFSEISKDKLSFYVFNALFLQIRGSFLTFALQIYFNANKI